MKNKYNHINDCWEAIRVAKTLEEIRELFKEFPRWSGDWDIVLNPFNKPKGYYVVNYYYDSLTEVYEEDFEYLNIETEEDNCMLKDVTVFLLPNGKQFTVEGKVKPTDLVGCTYEEETTEVVDDCLVHCFTIKDTTSSREKAASILGQLELYNLCLEVAHDLDYILEVEVE